MESVAEEEWPRCKAKATHLCLTALLTLISCKQSMHHWRSNAILEEGLYSGWIEGHACPRVLRYSCMQATKMPKMELFGAMLYCVRRLSSWQSLHFDHHRGTINIILIDDTSTTATTTFIVAVVLTMMNIIITAVVSMITCMMMKGLRTGEIVSFICSGLHHEKKRKKRKKKRLRLSASI